MYRLQKNELGWSENLIFDTYTKWSRMLHNCGRDILFSVSTYKFREWNPEYCNMSRTTDDIRCRVYGSWENKYYGASFDEKDNPGSVMAIAEINNQSAKYAGNGYWNDPDMMVTGEQGLSINEQKAHFALWCIMSSPLILGNDPRFMNQAEREIILNKEAIGVNQDSTEQGFRISKSGDAEIWKKKPADKSETGNRRQGGDANMNNQDFLVFGAPLIGQAEIDEISNPTGREGYLHNLG